MLNNRNHLEALALEDPLSGLNLGYEAHLFCCTDKSQLDYILQFRAAAENVLIEQVLVEVGRRSFTVLLNAPTCIVPHQRANEQEGEHSVDWHKEVTFVRMLCPIRCVQLLKLALEVPHEPRNVLVPLHVAQVLGLDHTDHV